MNDIPRVLKEAGLRVTKPRTRILAHMQKSACPQSIITIADAVQKDVDQVTVYRTIDTLTKHGLVREVDLRKGRPLYEITDPHDHHHVVCTQCDYIEEVQACHAPHITDTILKHTKGFATISGHSMEFFGTCSSCYQASHQ